MQVSLLQLSVDDHLSLPERHANADRAIRAAAASGSALVVLPELWTVGAFNADAWAASSEPLAGPTARMLTALAKELRITLHGGSLVERGSDGRLFNTSLLIDPSGQVHASYRKIHLFAAAGREAEILNSGSDVVQTLPTATVNARLGLATCYDLRFPEMFRKLTVGAPHQGAEVVLLVASWPQVRLAHWRALAVARAIENQVWLLACNAVGISGGLPQGGHSLVISPTGEVVAEGGGVVEAVTASIELNAVQAARDAFPVWADRRFA